MTQLDFKRASHKREIGLGRRIRRFTLMFGLPLILLVAAGCKKPETPTPEAQQPSPQTTPAAAPAATPAAAPAPTQPVPSFSAAQKIGMFVYPKSNQTHDQQLIDEADCYNSVQQQTGINPEAAAPQAPTAADQSAAAEQGAAEAPDAKGGRVKGAAKGAAGGAVIGAVAGSAGKGAAIGATAGTIVGGRRQHKANEKAEEQGAQAAVSQQQQAYDQSNAQYNQQISTFKRGFSSCMSARGYSVQ